MNELLIHNPSLLPANNEFSSCSCFECHVIPNDYNDDITSTQWEISIPADDNTLQLVTVETTNKFLQGNSYESQLTANYEDQNSIDSKYQRRMSIISQSAPVISSQQPRKDTLPRRKSSRSSKGSINKNRAVKDKIYTDELNQTIIDTRREYDKTIPENYKFPKKQHKGNEDMSKKGFLLNVKEWIKTSKEEIKKSREVKHIVECKLEQSLQENKELRRKNEELQNTIQELQRIVVTGNWYPSLNM